MNERTDGKLDSYTAPLSVKQVRCDRNEIALGRYLVSFFFAIIISCPLLIVQYAK